MQHFENLSAASQALVKWAAKRALAKAAEENPAIARGLLSRSSLLKQQEVIAASLAIRGGIEELRREYLQEQKASRPAERMGAFSLPCAQSPIKM